MEFQGTDCQRMGFQGVDFQRMEYQPGKFDGRNVVQLTRFLATASRMAHGYASAELLQNVRLALRHQGCAVKSSEVARLLAPQPQSVGW